MSPILELNHAIEMIEGNTDDSRVLVLNTGAELTAEDVAMLQALYSRSPDSVLNHLNKLAKVGSGKFMDLYYVGYGHKSIGDCGTTVIFIEGVSMLTAKAIQDSMLYNGQECSTRYLDFSTQPFLTSATASPSLFGLSEVSVLERWRQFYVSNLDQVKAHVAKQFPRQEDEEEAVYQKAVNARAFDIMRSFLPAGASTSLSWATNLRQATDHLKLLLCHPLLEVRRVAEAIQKALMQTHPNSFRRSTSSEEVSYCRWWMEDFYLYQGSVSHHKMKEGVSYKHAFFDGGGLSRYKSVLESRPRGGEIPKKLGSLGVMQFEFLLDFGSYRDIQRQRAVIQQMPLLTTEYGFEKWYLEQLPEDVREEAVVTLGVFEHGVISDLTRQFGKVEAQYFIPMGYRVPCQVTGDLPALVYLVELRAGAMVHPTLRLRAQQMAKVLETHFGPSSGLVLHVDYSEVGRFDSRRGGQDIVAKPL